MKKTLFIFGILTLLTSCKDEGRAKAISTVENYSIYVDSLSNLDNQSVKENWSSIKQQNEEKLGEAKSAMIEMMIKMLWNGWRKRN